MYPESIITKKDQDIVTARVNSQDDYKKSMTKDRGKYVGFMAERKFMGWCQKNFFKCSQTDTHNDDFIVNGKTVDVKAKLRTVKTTGRHEASVWEGSISHQKPDYFVFVSIVKNQLVQLIGWLEFEQFMSKARVMTKGVDQGNMTIVENCRNVYHEQLQPMPLFLKVRPQDQTTDEWLLDYSRPET